MYENILLHGFLMKYISVMESSFFIMLFKNQNMFLVCKLYRNMCILCGKYLLYNIGIFILISMLYMKVPGNILRSLFA